MIKVIKRIIEECRKDLLLTIYMIMILICVVSWIVGAIFYISNNSYFKGIWLAFGVFTIILILFLEIRKEIKK